MDNGIVSDHSAGQGGSLVAVGHLDALACRLVKDPVLVVLTGDFWTSVWDYPASSKAWMASRKCSGRSR